MTAHHPSPTRPSPTLPAPRRAATSPGTVGAAAWASVAWALAFLGCAGLALLGRVPHPWTPSSAAVLASAAPLAVSWALVALSSLVIAALVVAHGRRARTVQLAGVALVATGLVVTLVVADVRALAFVGYLPMVLLALAGVGPVAGHLGTDALVPGAVTLAHAVGGLAVAATGVRVLDRARRLRGAGPLSWRAWARWGGPAVGVAVTVPLCYAVTRVAWALGIPLGVRPEMLAELGSARFAGLGLALFAVAGALLTTGLVARWGEVFWGWVPVVGGRPVPTALAVVPGLLVAGVVTSGGLSFWRLLVVGDLSEVPGSVADWAAWAPELLWPFWGAALAVATLAYAGRRAS